MGAAFPGHPASAQPHEGNSERMSSSLHGCADTTNGVPVHGRGTTLPSPSEVQKASNRNVRRNERSCRPPQHLQKSYGTTRIPRPRKMQSFRHHTKWPGIGLVQHTLAIVDLILQRAIHCIRLSLHQSSDVQEVELSFADHKVEPTGKLEAIHPEI